MDFSATSAILEQGYERLRREVLATDRGGTSAPGLGVFVRQGMIGWIKVYSLCSTPIAPSLPRRSAGAMELPRGLVDDVTRILVGMTIVRKGLAP